jgi:hypothetical protein
MKPFSQFANRYWGGGLLLAATGVIIARIVSPTLEHGPRELSAAAGELLAVIGLFVIAVGVSRRLRGGESPKEDPSIKS